VCAPAASFRYFRSKIKFQVMIKRILGAALLTGASLVSAAQINPTDAEEKAMKSLAAVPDSGWVRGGTLGFNSAATYLNQWAAGGNNAVNLSWLLNYSINYRKGKNAWDNTFDMAYGLQLLGFDERAIKTDDKIDFTSKYGRQASEKWFYAGLVNFKTQFAPGYAVGANGIPLYDQPKISNFMAPAFTLISIGMDYKPGPKLTAFISPITFRGIIVLDDLLAAQGAFGVEKGEVGVNDAGQLVVVNPGQNLRSEVGAYARAQYKADIAKNINLSSRIELFSNYLDKPGNIDISFQNLLSMKTNEWLTTTIFTHHIYDDNTTVFRGFDKETNTPTNPGPGLQSKFVIGLGVNFKI
jgi:hypothetical protein